MDRIQEIKNRLRELGAKGDEITDDEVTEIETLADELEVEEKKAARASRVKGLLNRIGHAPSVPGTQGGEEDLKAESRLEYVGHFGGAFVESPAMKSYRESYPQGPSKGTPFQIEAKGLGGVRELGLGQYKGVVEQKVLLLGGEDSKATLTSTTGLPSVEREPGLRNYLPFDEPLTFTDLVTSGTTDQPWSEYRQVIAETDNADIVAEGELKPLSDVEVGTAESRAYVYADGFDVTNQTLSDDGALVTFMDSRIRRHVRNKVEDMLLNGPGTTGRPTGILYTSGTLSQAFDTDVITTLARALEKFDDANDDAPQAIVLHPNQLWKMRLLRENGTSGQYLLGNPFAQGAIASPFGVPIVASRRLGVNQALVGRFDSVNLLQLDPLNVLVFNQHKDYAQRNMAYVRAELRARQLIYTPREIVVTSLAAA